MDGFGLKPKFVEEFLFKPKPPYNLHLTVKAYNFPWFFKNKKSIIPINIENSNFLCLTYRGKQNLIHSKVYTVEDENTVKPQKIEEKIRFVLGLDEDLLNFYQMIWRDPILYNVPKVLAGMRLRTTSLWNSLLIGVCQQNANFLQGWRMVLNLHKLFGEKLNFFGKKIFLPPNPKTIVKYKDRLREARLGYRSKTIKKIAETFLGEADFEKEVEKMGDRGAVEKLCLIKGVGEYTAKLALVFSQRRYSLLPIDRWLMRLASKAYKIKKPNMRRVEKFLLKRWNGWCGLAVFFVTIVLDAEPISLALKRLKKGELTPKLKSEKPTPLTMCKLLW